MTTFPAGKFDIAVIGAGHAGVEAALAAAIRLAEKLFKGEDPYESGI